MKKRLISLLLTLSMVFSMVPMLGIGVGAKTAAQMTEAEAFVAGLDVYVAWYNHRRSYNGIVVDPIQVIYEDDLSAFNKLFSTIYPGGVGSDKTESVLASAEKWVENFYDGVDQFSEVEREIIMSLILSCFLYTGQEDGSSNNEVEEIQSKAQDTLIDGLNIYNFTWTQDLLGKSLQFRKNISPLEFLADMSQELDWGQYALDIGVSIFTEGLSTSQEARKAIATAAEYDTIKSLSASDIDILREYETDGIIGDYIKLYTKAYDDLWKTGESSFKEELLKQTGNLTDTFIDLSATTVSHAAGAVTAQFGAAGIGIGASVIGAIAGGFILFNILEGVFKLGGDVLFGQDAMKAADLTLFYLNWVRYQFYNGYKTAYREFRDSPTHENAQKINTYSRIMYKIFAASEMYVSQLNDTYANAGWLNWDGLHNIPGGIDPSLTKTAKTQSKNIKQLRENYLYNALDAYSDFCENYVYKISMNLNGGVFPVAEQLGFNQNAINFGKIHSIVTTIPAGIPYRDGYKFMGWTTDPNATKADPKYAPGSAYTTDAPLTLYAVWVQVNTVTYDAQKGTVSPSYSTYSTGDSVTLPIPKRNGYDFLGWSKTRTATNGEYKGGQSCNFGSGSFILYAIWKPKSFNVIFDADGGYFPKAGSSTITKTKEYNQAFVIDIEAPEKSGCTFAGKWVHVNGTNGKVETYDHDALKTIYSIGDSTLNAKTLTAVWIDNNTENIPDAPAPSYTIQYNANVPEGVTVKNLPSAQTKTDGTAIALSFAKPTRTGYTFLGWNPKSYESDASDAYAPGSLYSVDANLTLYAIWKQNAVSGTGIPGDIDGDEKVNNRDLIALRLYIDKKASRPLAVDEIAVDAEALDVNGNGKSAEEADFDTLMKYLTNWDVDIYYGTGKDINRYFTVTHSTQGDLLSAGTIEVWNGGAHMTWNINSSHAWTAETTMTWCTFDKAGSKRSASGSAGQQELVIYLNDTQTSTSRTGKVKFTVDGETYTITLKQQKAELSVSHPDYTDVLKAQPIRLFNNSGTKMNLTVTSTHNWTAEIQNASSNWLTAEKTSNTNILITTKTYASASKDNTADIVISVNGDIYTIAVYQSAKPEPVTSLDAPKGVSVYAIDHESISVSWYSVDNAENYEVYRSTSRSSGYKCVATVTETEYIDTGLNEDTKYYYKIKACAGDIKSDYSSYDYATTDEGIPVSFSATHPDHGELVDVGNIEVINGEAYMTWTINSSHAWEAETSMAWCYFDSARTERETSGPAGKSTLKIYLNDSQTSSKRTGKVRFTVNGETFTVTLMQKKAKIEISHPDYPDVIDDQPIHLYNNANISMNWTVDSTHDWTASIDNASSDWVKVTKTSNTNLRLTTLWYASGSRANTATVVIYVNGDVYEIEIYQD